MNTCAPIVESVREAGLVYTSDRQPGITRRPVGDDFEYLDPSGNKIDDDQVLTRIRSLAIPPAYSDVWVCLDPRGHLQATGRDAKGRKQYRYHPDFRQVRDEHKFENVLEFGQALPRIHARLDRDLRRRGLPREKVLATVVHLLEASLIRVGNEEYARQNHSYGLTTLRNRHVKVKGERLLFDFTGKSGVRHRITLSDPRLARVVAKLQDLPGQDLFQYCDDDSCQNSVTSHDVNEYLREISGKDFTAKDFRTWAATVLAYGECAKQDPPTSKADAKRRSSEIVKRVAERLGNTPTVCRKCYIHPAVLEAYVAGCLRRLPSDDDEVLDAAVLKMLRHK